MFAIAGTLVACNNASDTEKTEDSTVVTTETAPAPTPDTTVVVTPPVTDTVVVDTTKK